MFHLRYRTAAEACEAISALNKVVIVAPAHGDVVCSAPAEKQAAEEKAEAEEKAAAAAAAGIPHTIQILLTIVIFSVYVSNV